MAIDQSRIAISDKDDLEINNGEALLNVVALFYFDDGTEFDFSAYVSAYMKVFQSDNISAKKIKEYTSQITRSANMLVFNCSESDMTFTSNGKYWYEIGYVRSGGYELALREGNLFVR